MLRARPSPNHDDARRVERGPDGVSPGRTSVPSFARRTPLPNGRAIVGAMLIVAAAVGVFAAYLGASEGPSQQVVVAASDLPAGRRLAASDLRLEQVELPGSLLERTFVSIETVVGSVTLASLRPGELVQASTVAAPDAGAPTSFREFSFAVDRERAVNGELQRGERVDVLATVGADAASRTAVVARDVPIVGIDGGPKGSSIGAGGRLTVTVTLTTSDAALRLVHATQTGSITLVRTTYAAGTEPGSIDSVTNDDSLPGAGDPTPRATPGSNRAAPAPTTVSPTTTATTSDDDGPS